MFHVLSEEEWALLGPLARRFSILQLALGVAYRSRSSSLANGYSFLSLDRNWEQFRFPMYEAVLVAAPVLSSFAHACGPVARWSTLLGKRGRWNI